MKALICPQCGGKITEYSAWQQFATCIYCETKFLIERENQKALPDDFPDSTPLVVSGPNLSAVIIGVVAAFLVLGGIILIGILASRKNSRPNEPVYIPPRYSTPAPTPLLTPTPNPNLLEFGGKGTGNGLFQDAGSIAVDREGRIYVADATLRVQQFNQKGEFLKVWQIPSETSYYKRARSIEKIAVDDKNRLHVLINVGIVLIYENDGSEPQKIVHFAPNPIQDFVFRSDGGRLYLINGESSEYLVHVNEAGKTVRRVNAFHTEAADPVMSPRETGISAIRLAVDGAGNIFSVYAFGDIGSYQLSYNDEEMMIYRFTPEAKYVNKFGFSMKSCGIEVDNQSRIYLTDDDSLNIYTNTGEQVATIPNLNHVDAFALDRENNIYILNDDKVFKRAAIK